MPMVTNFLRSRSRRKAACAFYLLKGIAVIAVFVVAVLALADARSDYLIRLLKESSQFRVRAQAAISLGSARADAVVIEALAQALSDKNAAVRAASASSLERIGDRSVVPVLTMALSDEEQVVRSAAKRAIAAIKNKTPTSIATSTYEAKEASVPTGPSKYYIGIGMPGSRAPSVDRESLNATRQFIEAQVRAIDGVMIAKEKETPAKVRSLLKSKKLEGYYLDSSLVSLGPSPEGGVRAVVSIIVGTYPERNMRTILQGSARVTGNADSAKKLAIEGAFRGALRQLPKVLSLGNQQE